MPPPLVQHKHLVAENELNRMALFSTCSANFVQALARVADVRRYGAWEKIIQQGSSYQCVKSVLIGKVKVFCGEDPVGELGCGKWIGETLLLGLESTWKVSLVADRWSEICIVSRESLVEVLSSFREESQILESMAQQVTVEEDPGSMFRATDFFDGLSDVARLQLAHTTWGRIFFPGQPILQEGARGDELVILVKGSASVEMQGTVIRQVTAGSDAFDYASDGVTKPPVLFGELGFFLMLPVRNATVRAQTACLVRMLFRATFGRVLDESRESIRLQQLQRFIGQRYNKTGGVLHEGSSANDLTIFKEMGCQTEFLEFLANHMEDRVYMDEQKVIDEELPCDNCMFVLVNGSVIVTKRGESVAELGAGSFFGQIAVLGVSAKRNSTVSTKVISHVRALHQTIILRALERFPHERSKFLHMAFSAHVTGSGVRTPEYKQLIAGSNEQRRSLGLAVLHKALRSSATFSRISSSFAEALADMSTERIFLPGDLIIQEGSTGSSMFIFIAGEARVLKQGATNAGDSATMCPSTYGKRRFSAFQRIGSLTAGCITGELAMLGLSTMRTATIEATSICSTWEITQDSALAYLDNFPSAQAVLSSIIIEHLDYTVPDRISSLPFFSTYDAKFRSLLSTFCKRSVFFPSQEVARQGRPGEGLQIINQGLATLSRNGCLVKTYRPGCYFGETIMLGIHKHSVGTLVAVKTCHVLTITRESYQLAFQRCPLHRVDQKMVSEERAKMKIFMDALDHMAARAQTWAQMAFTPGTFGSAQDSCSKDCFKAWAALVYRRLRAKRLKLRRKQELHRWVLQQRGARVQRDWSGLELSTIFGCRSPSPKAQQAQLELLPLSKHNPVSTECLAMLFDEANWKQGRFDPQWQPKSVHDDKDVSRPDVREEALSDLSDGEDTGDENLGEHGEFGDLSMYTPARHERFGKKAEAENKTFRLPRLRGGDPPRKLTLERAVQRYGPAHARVHDVIR